jgi:hypothetical protein
MKSPHLAILHTTSIPRDAFTEFARLVSAENLDFQIQSREPDGPFAGMEWLLPTAVIVYIGKSYFDGFLKEMGKDHYALLKAGFGKLQSKLLGSEAPKMTIISTQGKTRSDQKYSLMYSILAEAGEGINFKLLIQREITEENYEQVIAAFLEFLQAFHSNSLTPEKAIELSQARVVGRTVLLAYDPEKKVIVSVDPIPRWGDGDA